jgi:hypothetical protein
VVARPHPAFIAASPATGKNRHPRRGTAERLIIEIRQEPAGAGEVCPPPLVQFREQDVRVERLVHCHVEDAAVHIGPAFGRAIPIEFDAVTIRVVEVQRLGHAVVRPPHRHALKRRTIQNHARIRSRSATATS